MDSNLRLIVCTFFRLVLFTALLFHPNRWFTFADSTRANTITETTYHHFGAIYINLRIYYDNDLFSKFRQNIDRLRNFILATIQSSAKTYHNYPLNQLANFVFIVQSIEKVPETVTLGPQREANRYRSDLYRSLHTQLREQTYTTSVLLTNLNFLYKSNTTETQGLAIIGNACRQGSDRSIVVQARSYRTALILAHEIGHSLGLRHDEEPDHDDDDGHIQDKDHNSHSENIGPESCGSNHIMSFTTGPGKTTFSSCSARRLNASLSAAMQQLDVAKCFMYVYPNPVAKFPGTAIAPISATEQCHAHLGTSFFAIDTRNENDFRTATDQTVSRSSVCSRIKCTNDLVVVDIHPALEDTPCGPSNEHCCNGRCQRKMS